MAQENSFRLFDCTNLLTDGLRRRLSASGGGLWGRFWSSVDSGSYNRGLVAAMRKAHAGNVDLWLGDWARGRGNRPVVSFAQGPPGTDATSVFERRDLIERLAGKLTWLKMAAYARWRLTSGLPKFEFSDHVIVGSQWSRQRLIEMFGLNVEQTHALPYPIDLQMFQPPRKTRGSSDPIRLLWLGRFAPRKRLDLFLDGLELAIELGCNVEAWVIGRSDFVPGFEKLLERFPYSERLCHWPKIDRKDVPTVLAEVDVLVQPSDHENFGSSVAEALACGVPCIVGQTNGTGDYVCDRSIVLKDDSPESMAEAILSMARNKSLGELQDHEPSRRVAEKYFDPDVVAGRLVDILSRAAKSEC